MGFGEINVPTSDAGFLNPSMEATMTSERLQLIRPDVRESLRNWLKTAPQSAPDSEQVGKHIASELVSILRPEDAARLGTEGLRAADTFLLSCVRNPGFMRWLGTMQSEIETEMHLDQLSSASEIANRKLPLHRIAEGLVAYGDPALLSPILTLPRARPGSEAVVTHDVAVVTAIAVAVIVVITAIDVTPRVPHEGNVTPAEMRAIADAVTTAAARVQL